MKKKSSILIYLLLAVSIIMISFTTTLALIRDSESKVSNILKFDKVSLYADKAGSVLSFEVRSESVGYGQVVYDIEYDEPLKITPTNDTEDMFLRFNLSFSLNNDKLDEENEELLEKLNNEELIHKGIVLNNDNNNGYGFTYVNGWYYLVTNATGEDQNLKVARLTDVDGFEILDKFTLYYDQLLENDIISLCEQHSIYLKIDAVAIQCLGLSNLTPEELGEVILSNEGQTNYEDLYGNIKIKHFEAAIYENYIGINGDGTEENPYHIRDYKDLIKIKENVNSGKETYAGKYFKVVKDIDLSKIDNFTPIGTQENPFQGFVDGNDKIISNMKINTGNINVGLFGVVKNAVIRNLIMEACSITTTFKGNVFAGFIVGRALSSEISNSIVKNTCIYSTTCSQWVGGLIGYMNGKSMVTNCINYANISSYFATGGIIGAVNSDSANFTHISYCKNYGKISVIGSQSYCGGITSYLDAGHMSYCLNYGEVHGFNDMGGICGFVSINSTLTKSKNLGNIYGNRCSIAGVVGYANGSISECCNYGVVTINHKSYDPYCFVGGICGINGYNTISNCYNRGKVQILENVATGDSSWNGIAGITGQIVNGAKLFNCYNVAHMISRGYNCMFIGGVIGEIYDYTSIYNIYSNNSWESSSYTRRFHQHATYGRLNYGSISKYYQITSSNPVTAEKLNSDVFMNDMQNINGGYPILKWELEYK